MSRHRIEPFTYAAADAWDAMMACEVCSAPMAWVKAHYTCRSCAWIKPCCEPDQPAGCS